MAGFTVYVTGSEKKHTTWLKHSFLVLYSICLKKAKVELL